MQYNYLEAIRADLELVFISFHGDQLVWFCVFLQICVFLTHGFTAPKVCVPRERLRNKPCCPFKPSLRRQKCYFYHILLVLDPPRFKGREYRHCPLSRGMSLSRFKKNMWNGVCDGVATFGKYNPLKCLSQFLAQSKYSISVIITIIK